MSIIFGPIRSRRFGLSLGVDLSPTKKQCNFDCLYCEIPKAKRVDSFEDSLEVSEIIEAIKDALKQHQGIDVLTITANGEPTLYPYFQELVGALKELPALPKLLLLTNSSGLTRKELWGSFAQFDILKCSLDSLDSRLFKKIDRAIEKIDIEQIKVSLLEFTSSYEGELVIEILVVDGVNDSDANIAQLNRFLEELKPARIDLGTIDRPPAYEVRGVSYDRLLELKALFSPKLNVVIAAHKPSSSVAKEYSSDALLKLLALRPLSVEDAELLLDNASRQRLKNLLSSGAVSEHFYEGQLFFKKAIDK